MGRRCSTNGAVMMVDPVDSTGKLMVGEGIETCLAARQMHEAGLGSG
jgi:hypothetical protein